MPAHEAAIDIVLPVHGAADDLRRCVQSVLGHTQCPFRLFILDDASRDPDVDAVLGEVSGRSEVTVWRESCNRGFASSVNCVLCLGSADVVVMSSDVIVTPRWLSKLAAAAHSRPRVATVTPLTNLGSICTIPAASIRHDLSTADGIDALAAEVEFRSLMLRPEIPVGVGFCLYIRREALESAGLLEGNAGHEAYSEEVEFCRQTRRLGFVHLMDDSTFVYRRGAAPSAGSNEELIVEHGEILSRRPPDFEQAGRAYEISSPARAVFRNLERTVRPVSSKPNILFVMHRPPSGVGGIERHTTALAEALGDHFRVSLCYPSPGRLWLDVYSDDKDEPPRSFAFPVAGTPADPGWDTAYEEALGRLVMVARPHIAHVQHLEGHALSALAVLMTRGARTFVSLRDYYLLCPSFHLQHKGDGYCGVPASLAVCDACLATTFGWRAGALAARRRRVDELLRRVEGVIVPHPSVLEVFGRAFDVSAWRTHIHEHGLLSAPESQSSPDGGYFIDGPLRVAFVGTAQPVKGYGAFNRLADRLARERIEFLHLGNLAGQPAHPRIQYLGAYAPDQVVSMLREQRVHLVLILSRCPETHSHVLSEAVAAGIPVAVTDLGALAERVTRTGVGWTVPRDDVNAVEDLVRRLADDRSALYQCSRAAARVAVRTMQIDAAELTEVYGMPDIQSEERDPKEGSSGYLRLADTVAAFAADNALLAQRLRESREECERLRRCVGQAPQMSFGVDDIEATRAYQLALKIRRAWLRVPYVGRHLIERLVIGGR